MWLVRWFGREDPDPRQRWLETECATFGSASGLAHRLSHGDATRISVKRVAGYESRHRPPAVILRPDRAPSSTVDAVEGLCRHELRPAWCVLCR
jgi:hypothetical protein